MCWEHALAYPNHCHGIEVSVLYRVHALENHVGNTEDNSSKSDLQCI